MTPKLLCDSCKLINLTNQTVVGDSNLNDEPVISVISAHDTPSTLL